MKFDNENESHTAIYLIISLLVANCVGRFSGKGKLKESGILIWVMALWSHALTYGQRRRSQQPAGWTQRVVAGLRQLVRQKLGKRGRGAGG